MAKCNQLTLLSLKG